MALLISRKGMHQIACQIFNAGQWAQGGIADQRRFSRVGAKEGGRGRHNLATDNRIVEGDVMAFKAPAPRLLIIGRAKDRDVIETRVTPPDLSRKAFLAIQQCL